MADAGRRIFRQADRKWETYDLDGPVQDDFGLIPLSFKRELGQGCYYMRMDPGAVTIAHNHRGIEDFIVLEGELIDDDGVVIGPGDFVSYEQGSYHNSRTETGCVILVIEWREQKLD